MSTSLTINDIDESVRSQVYTQQYGAKPTIEGVAILPVKHVVTQDGDFSELLRLPENGIFDQVPDFVVRQVNRSLLYPASIKGWHLHLVQDELWYVPSDSHLLIGLWDVRSASPTKGVNLQIGMGGGKEVLLFIPHGVAHGCANVSDKPATVFYFANQTFNKDNPDEQRIPFDALGAGFWQPKKD
jgi:dTDP-4-dehydrorhamnose 3,5-epimerase